MDNETFADRLEKVAQRISTYLIRHEGSPHHLRIDLRRYLFFGADELELDRREHYQPLFHAGVSVQYSISMQGSAHAGVTVWPISNYDESLKMTS